MDPGSTSIQITGFFLYSNVTFELAKGTCDTIDIIREGVEFSIRMNSEGVWIPITFITPEKIALRSQIPIVYCVNEDDVEIREYHVKRITFTNIVYHSVQMCDFSFPMNSTQFRWLQTSQIPNMHKVRDAWTLDNVHISVYDGSTSVDLLQDSFNEPELK